MTLVSRRVLLDRLRRGYRIKKTTLLKSIKRMNMATLICTLTLRAKRKLTLY